jgi:AcrR family transcriptional regulator
MRRNSKQLVLDAATKIFAERGFYGARVTDITDASSVNVRIIYHFFGSKENLYDEVLRSALERLVCDPIPSGGYATSLVAWEAASNWQAAARIFDDAELRLFCLGGRLGAPLDRAYAWAQAMTDEKATAAPMGMAVGEPVGV